VFPSAPTPLRAQAAATAVRSRLLGITTSSVAPTMPAPSDDGGPASARARAPRILVHALVPGAHCLGSPLTRVAAAPTAGSLPAFEAESQREPARMGFVAHAPISSACSVVPHYEFSSSFHSLPRRLCLLAYCSFLCMLVQKRRLGLSGHASRLISLQRIRSLPRRPLLTSDAGSGLPRSCART
jgi:hypothetical protein